MDTKRLEEKAQEMFGEDGLFCAESVLTIKKCRPITGKAASLVAGLVNDANGL